MLQTVALIIKIILILFFSITLSIYDIKSCTVPVWIIITGAAAFFIERLIFEAGTLPLYMLSSILLFVIYMIVKISTRNKLGMGDVLFGIFQGFGFKPWYIWLCLAFETFTALAFYLLTRSKRTKKMPFIPFMASGLLIAFIVDCFL